MSDMKKCILAVDGGGTFHKAALFCGMELVENSFISVPANSAGTAEEISGAFRNLGREAAAKAEAMGYEIEAVGMCMPGPFDYITGTLKMDHKFAAAKGEKIAPWLQETLGDVPVYFGHDATVFVRGGVFLEKLSDHSKICGATLGTGLGFGSMMDGKVLVNETGLPTLSLWGRPYMGSIAEEFISRRAVIREFEAKSDKRGLDVYDISLLARAGDEAALRAFSEMGRHLGIVAGDVVEENGFSAFILGGAISKSADLILPAMLESLGDKAKNCTVRAVKDIDNAPLYGCAAMCEEHRA